MLLSPRLVLTTGLKFKTKPKFYELNNQDIYDMIQRMIQYNAI